MHILIPTTTFQLDQWIKELERTGHAYVRVVENGKDALQVDEDGKTRIAVFNEKMKRRESSNKKIFKVIGAGLVLVVAAVIFGTIYGSEPAVPLTPFEAMEQRRHEQFGEASKYRFGLAQQVYQKYLRNPSTGSYIDYRLIIVEQDSMTIVMGFEGDNDFGVTKQHSITMVADTLGGIARVVSFQ